MPLSIICHYKTILLLGSHIQVGLSIIVCNRTSPVPLLNPTWTRHEPDIAPT